MYLAATTVEQFYDYRQMFRNGWLQRCVRLADLTAVTS